MVKTIEALKVFSLSDDISAAGYTIHLQCQVWIFIGSETGMKQILR